MGDLERGFALKQAHLATNIGEADFRFAVAVEVKGRSVAQSDIANFANPGFIAIDAAEGADGDDRGDDEEEDGERGCDHDVAGEAALVFFADDLFDRGQRNLGSGALQPVGGFPSRFGAGEGDGVARIGFDPGADLRFFLRRRGAVKPDQQARRFRFYRGPAVAV